MYRFHFIDGSQRHYYDFHILEDGWASAYDNETHNFEYIPRERIHRVILLKENKEK
jgi:hypothetical protein